MGMLEKYVTVCFHRKGASYLFTDQIFYYYTTFIHKEILVENKIIYEKITEMCQTVGTSIVANKNLSVDDQQCPGVHDSKSSQSCLLVEENSPLPVSLIRKGEKENKT